MPRPRAPMHILVLTDRDWTHPQAGGTGTALRGQITRWLEWGHRVSVVTSSYPGAPRHERDGALEVHRAGRLKTAVPNVVRRVRRGVAADADVVFEVVNGVFFFTPLWLRRPCVTFVQHLSAGPQYRHELGWTGRPAGYLLETAPLRYLYNSASLMTISGPTADSMAKRGVPRAEIVVNHAGLEPEDFGPDADAPEPTLIHLGRLKRYKNIEGVLDVLEDVPGTRLDVVGEGDHRPALEDEIERRDLSDRVTLHGYVSEDRKRELLGRAWLNVTASTAEGWGLAVTEAAARGTPSVTVPVGGLREAVVDGHTGLLAADREELSDAVRRVIEDGDLRSRLGAAAREHARQFSWEAMAERTLDTLEAARDSHQGRPSITRAAAGSDTGRAIGLAAAAMATNVIGLVLTIVFARLLGTGGYGALAALMSAFLILGIPGQALQVEFAKHVSTSPDDGRVAGELGRWVRFLLAAAGVTAVAGVLLRDLIASAIGVEDVAFGAAAVLPTACIWLLLSVQRGVLQGLGSYRVVGLSLMGEGLARLAVGAVLILAGLGAVGAFLGSVAGMAITAAILARRLSAALPATGAMRERGRRMAETLRGAMVPLIGLALLAWLQNVDVIVVKHQAATDAAASSYAAASVAAKMVFWIGVGLGLFLLPEAARRSKLGADGRSVLARTLGIVALVGVPMVAVYSVAGRQLLEGVFGPRLGVAADALPWLGVAMSLLACVYLCVQYLLAVRSRIFLAPLVAAALLQPLLLAAAGTDLTTIALMLVGIQLGLVGVVFAMSFRSRTWVHAPEAQAAQQ